MIIALPLLYVLAAVATTVLSFLHRPFHYSISRSLFEGIRYACISRSITSGAATYTTFRSSTTF